MQKPIWKLNVFGNLEKFQKAKSFAQYLKLEDTARYAGFLLAPSGKKELFMLFSLILGCFWCSVVTSVTFSSNLKKFEKNL